MIILDSTVQILTHRVRLFSIWRPELGEISSDLVIAQGARELQYFQRLFLPTQFSMNSVSSATGPDELLGHWFYFDPVRPEPRKRSVLEYVRNPTFSTKFLSDRRVKTEPKPRRGFRAITPHLAVRNLGMWNLSSKKESTRFEKKSLGGAAAIYLTLFKTGLLKIQSRNLVYPNSAFPILLYRSFLPSAHLTDSLPRGYFFGVIRDHK